MDIKQRSRLSYPRNGFLSFIAVSKLLTQTKFFNNSTVSFDILSFQVIK